MNQPSSLKSLDHLDTSSDSSDSQSECESITIPDPNNPDTVQRFIDSTIPHREPKIEQVSIINSQDVHIGTRHSFHFHGVPLPSKPINEEPNGNADLETNTPWTSRRLQVRWCKSNLPFVAGCALMVAIVIILLTRSDFSDPVPPQGLVERKWWRAAEPIKKLTPFNFSPSGFKLIITHTKGKSCSDFKECSRELRRLQSMNMKLGEPDIEYNFLVGGRRMYEGLGWKFSNPNNSQRAKIAYMGNFEKEPPEEMRELVLKFTEDIYFDNKFGSKESYCRSVEVDGLTVQPSSIVHWPNYCSLYCNSDS